MSTIMLLHGAFQGGWVWGRTADALRALGHDVYAPTLTGCGERGHLLRKGLTMADWIEDVVSVMRHEELCTVTLVGHSWSGLLAHAVAVEAGPRVVGLAMVDAVLPVQGKSFRDVAGPEFAQMLARHTDGDLVRPWPLPAFGVEDEETKAWFAARIASFPLSGFTEPFAWDETAVPARRTYISCTRTAMPLIRRMAEEAPARGFAMRTLDSGHCPMATVPAPLAELLHEAASLRPTA
ncbi:putative esterase [Desulfovibrio sp. X2]|uniref:alpha/beta fold hydrolase n=1 Tax=Desulfovibrio sp. X2 TaxID=941449 RepID=UPI000358EB5B|nr:alpha/beta hydrolase [Desulfovibrio sp. X2]EPR37028.1 putative esterase [Desulfovibrio sp. X2]